MKPYFLFLMLGVWLYPWSQANAESTMYYPGYGYVSTGGTYFSNYPVTSPTSYPYVYPPGTIIQNGTMSGVPTSTTPSYYYPVSPTTCPGGNCPRPGTIEPISTYPSTTYPSTTQITNPAPVVNPTSSAGNDFAITGRLNSVTKDIYKDDAGKYFWRYRGLNYVLNPQLRALGFGSNGKITEYWKLNNLPEWADLERQLNTLDISPTTNPTGGKKCAIVAVGKSSKTAADTGNKEQAELLKSGLKKKGYEGENLAYLDQGSWTQAELEKQFDGLLTKQCTNVEFHLISDGCTIKGEDRLLPDRLLGKIESLNQKQVRSTVFLNNCSNKTFFEQVSKTPQAFDKACIITANVGETAPKWFDPNSTSVPFELYKKYYFDCEGKSDTANCEPNTDAFKDHSSEPITLLDAFLDASPHDAENESTLSCFTRNYGYISSRQDREKHTQALTDLHGEADRPGPTSARNFIDSSHTLDAFFALHIGNLKDIHLASRLIEPKLTTYKNAVATLKSELSKTEPSEMPGKVEAVRDAFNDLKKELRIVQWGNSVSEPTVRKTMKEKMNLVQNNACENKKISPVPKPTPSPSSPTTPTTPTTVDLNNALKDLPFFSSADGFPDAFKDVKVSDDVKKKSDWLKDKGAKLHITPTPGGHKFEVKDADGKVLSERPLTASMGEDEKNLLLTHLTKSAAEELRKAEEEKKYVCKPDAETEKYSERLNNLARNTGKEGGLVDAQKFVGKTTERELNSRLGTTGDFTLKKADDVSGFKFIVVDNRKSPATEWYLSEAPHYKDQFPKDKKFDDGLPFGGTSFILWKKGSIKDGLQNPDATMVDIEAKDFFESSVKPMATRVNPYDDHIIAAGAKLNPAGIAMQIKKALEYEESENADRAGASDFDLPKDGRIGYIAIHDNDDKDVVMKSFNDQVRLFPKLMAKHGYRFEMPKPGCNSPTMMSQETKHPKDLIREQIQQLRNRGVKDIFLNLSGHGGDKHIAFKDKNGEKVKLFGSDIKEIVDEFKDLNFTLYSCTCHTGGLNKELKEYIDSKDNRVRAILQSKPDGFGQEGRIQSRKDIPDAISNYYDIFLEYYLTEPRPDGGKRTLGEAHLLADKAAKRYVGSDAHFFSSRKERKSEDTARDPSEPSLRPGDRRT